jgi:parallel beta-helix repeat protein
MKIFISHINEEQGIATVLKNWIESTFLGQHAVFVSSSPDDIPAGSKWLEKIDNALNDSSIYIVLCSPKSVKRNWINFETGCAWIKKVPVIPICHSGMLKGELPSPLSFFQGLNIETATFPQDIFKVLAKYLSVEVIPRIATLEMNNELKIAINEIEDNLNKVDKGSKKDNITPINPLGGKTIIVSKSEGGDYETINDAIEKASEKDQIFIHSGIYEEGYIRLHGKKTYRIVGENRESVIVFGSFSIDAYESEISNISFIATNRTSVCANIMSGKNKIDNCKFTRGRDGLMIQRSGDLKESESETTITNCLLVDNLQGIWIGISGRAIIRNNIFENNLVGLLNAEKLKQNSSEIAETNEFIDNSRADYVTGWDYQDGTMSNFYNWDSKKRIFIETTLPENLRKINTSR